MVDQLRERLPEIEALCRRFGATHLDVFGSASRADFDPIRSDYDFLVEFTSRGDVSPASQYFGLLHSREDLLGRSVHLAENFPGQNATFLGRIEPDREQLYAA